jgi:acyl phosphate:glycerol-3-phosphate acyltransferase
MLIFLGILLACYLLGAVAGSLVLGKLQGVDIRLLGSGNAGATNALRTKGWKFALGTMLIDVLKGVIAVKIFAPVAFARTAWLDDVTVQWLAAVAAVLGHCFPIYFGFRGGKGAGTAVGACLVIVPSILPWVLLIWATCLSIFGYVGLCTCVAALSLAVFNTLPNWQAAGPSRWIVFGMALLIIWMHRSNLQRVFNQTESRFDKVMIWHRLFAAPRK